jgi:hypothetical protein
MLPRRSANAGLVFPTIPKWCSLHRESLEIAEAVEKSLISDMGQSGNAMGVYFASRSQPSRIAHQTI